MGKSVITSLAAEAKKMSQLASDITDEIGKQLTGIDKKKIIQSVKDRLKDFDSDKVDKGKIIKSVTDELKDSKGDPAPAKPGGTKMSLRERREARRKQKQKSK